MKKLLKISLYEGIIITLWYISFILVNEYLLRVYYLNRANYLYIIPLVIIPIIVVIIYFMKKDRIKEMFPKWGVVIISLSWIVLSILITFLIITLFGNSLGHCNVDLEPPSSGLFSSCFLSGIEYYFMPLLFIIPDIIIIIYHIGVFINKVFSKERRYEKNGKKI